MDIFSQFHHDLPKYKEKALAPLEIREFIHTPPKIVKFVLSPP